MTVTSIAAPQGRVTEASSSSWSKHVSPLPSDRLLRFSDATLILFLMGVVLLCYANILGNGFVYDDNQQILQNPYVKSWHFLPEIFTTTVWSFVGQVGTTNYYRPLMTFSFLLLWKLFGPIPFAFHLCSVVFHAAVVVMVFLTGARLFHDRRVGFVAALLFAVHPVHTEAVAWIAALPDLQATFFLLLAFWLILEPDQITWRQQAFSAVCFLLALLAKEPSVMLVPLVILYAHQVAPGSAAKSMPSKVRSYAPLLALGLAYLALRVVLLGKLAPVLQHPGMTWPSTFYSAASLVLSYVRLLLWPTRLSAFHVFHPTSHLLQSTALAGIAIFLLCFLGSLRLLRTFPPLGFTIFWIGLTLAPVLNARWMASNVLTERYLYLPSVGFCWFAAWCAVRLWDLPGVRASRVYRVASVAILAVLLVAASAKTVLRNSDWQSDLRLYSATLETDPGADVIRSNLGGTYFDKGDLARASYEWERALAGKPDSVNTMNALGIVYTKQGRIADAQRILLRAIRTKPLWADPHYNYGLLLQKMGDSRGALDEFQKAVELAPLNPVALRCYAEALQSVGDFAKAESEYHRSLDLDPSFDTLRSMAGLYLQTRQLSSAEAMLRQIVARFPYDSQSHLDLARLLAESGRTAEARQEFLAVLNTDPLNKEAALALRNLGQVP